MQTLTFEDPRRQTFSVLDPVKQCLVYDMPLLFLPFVGTICELHVPLVVFSLSHMNGGLSVIEGILSTPSYRRLELRVWD